MSTGGSQRAPRVRPKVHLVLFSGLFATAHLSQLIRTIADLAAAVASARSPSGTGERHPGGAGRRRSGLVARRTGTGTRLGVHDARAARRPAVGGTPGREVGLLGRGPPRPVRLVGAR